MFASETSLKMQIAISGRQRDLALYRSARLRGRRGRLLAALTHRSRALLPLPSQAADGHFAGQQVVSIDQIRGSEGRTQDFDRDFNPLRDVTQGRWLSVLRALRQGQSLPPVELVKVGPLYYVRDGHHRISVARAMGQEYVEATVQQVR
jgi:hypothetical protein